jgi:hypothetical protein
MALRARVYLAAAVGLVIVVLTVVLVIVEYTVSVAGSTVLHNDLGPASDASASLSLAEANASGALTDYVLSQRDRSLADYRENVALVEALLAQLDQALPQDLPELREPLAQAQSAFDAWLATDAEPTVVAMQAGQDARAARITNSRAAWTSYEAMTAAASELGKTVTRVRNETADLVASFNRLLGLTLAALALLTIGLIVGALLVTRWWVLNPLTALRGDLRAAREGDHEAPIRPTGPPELREVGTDAERLRRGLVAEIDEAREAREGLAQDAPLVAAVHDELRSVPDVSVPGVVVAGISRSAQGVIAGDWWDQVVLPDGRLGLIVADVSGHGPEAGVTALRVRTLLRSGLVQGLDPVEVVGMAALSCADDAHFVTGIILLVDPAGGTLSWLNAGHHPAIVVTHDKDASLCEPTGPLISSLGGAWTVRSTYFRAGDVVVAFTDGLVESRNAEGDELESSLVAQLLRGMDSPVRENPAELISRLLAQVRHRAADWRRDDVTLIAAARPR